MWLRSLNSKTKEALDIGKDADMVILDKDYRISDLIARGQIMTHNYRKIEKRDL